MIKAAKSFASSPVTRTVQPSGRVTSTVIDLQQARLAAMSQRQFANERGVPRSTLRGWMSRRDVISSNPKVVEFCESPEGIQFIQEILTAAMFEFCKRRHRGTADILRLHQAIAPESFR